MVDGQRVAGLQDCNTMSESTSEMCVMVTEVVRIRRPSRLVTIIGSGTGIFFLSPRW